MLDISKKMIPKMKLLLGMILLIVLTISLYFGLVRIYGDGEKQMNETEQVIQLMIDRVQNREEFKKTEMKWLNEYFDKQSSDSAVQKINNEASIILVRYLVERMSLTQDELNGFIEDLKLLQG